MGLTIVVRPNSLFLQEMAAKVDALPGTETLNLMNPKPF